MKLKILPWDKDEWLSRQGTILPFDKLEHFLLALLCVLSGILLLKINPQVVITIVSLIGIGWEIKDGLIPNSQGFSWKDLIADFAGISLGYFITYILI